MGVKKKKEINDEGLNIIFFQFFKFFIGKKCRFKLVSTKEEK